jgi:hypothetical protein
MTTVTGLTADRMLAIEAASVVDGDVDGSGNLILTKHDGSQINAGKVTGPPGPQGPIGSMLPVLSAAGILDVGLSSQIRAGRQLSPADFANIGLNAPLGLWNLSDLSDASGNGRALSNKGAVPFASGINGVANSAAQFVGNSGQALYISDTGANDPFRIKTGSAGAWVRTAKRGTSQYFFTKFGSAASLPVLIWSLRVDAGNQFIALGTGDGSTNIQPIGITDIADDRWHFCVFTNDGTQMRIYVDGINEASVSSIPFQSISAPVNIGGLGADSSTAAGFPFFGRIDEAFVTADVLSEDQVRSLYCVKIAHTLGAVPARVVLNVRRRKKGAAFAVTDFPTQPLRLYNFSAGSLGDQGSNNVLLTNPGGTVSVAGVDGSMGNAFNFNGSQSLPATDAGLPAGVAPRSHGCWFKTNLLTGAGTMIAWGSALGVGDARIGVSTGTIFFSSAGDAITGPLVADGVWHLAIAVEDNTSADGLKRKLYLDGKIVINSAVLNAIVLGGANHFRIGTASDASAQVYTGQIDSAFICDYALTADQVHALYAKGAQALSPSPKNVGDHIEGMDAASVYATFDTLDSQHQVDLAVA